MFFDDGFELYLRRVFSKFGHGYFKSMVGFGFKVRYMTVFFDTGKCPEIWGPEQVWVMQFKRWADETPNLSGWEPEMNSIYL